MSILVEDLNKASNFSLSYIYKLLRDCKVNNRYLLDIEDLRKLKKGLKVVGEQSYMLLIETNRQIDLIESNEVQNV